MVKLSPFHPIIDRNLILAFFTSALSSVFFSSIVPLVPQIVVPGSKKKSSNEIGKSDATQISEMAHKARPLSLSFVSKQIAFSMPQRNPGIEAKDQKIR